MLRIYLTKDGIEGYNKGCSCCSSEEKATLKDIQELILDLKSQTEKLQELYFLSEKYGEDTLCYWFTLLAEVSHRKARIEASKKYEKNPNIAGTHYKNCFETKSVDEEELNIANKAYSKVPNRAKKYLEGQ